MRKILVVVCLMLLLLGLWGCSPTPQEQDRSQLEQNNSQLDQDKSQASQVEKDKSQIEENQVEKDTSQIGQENQVEKDTSQVVQADPDVKLDSGRYTGRIDNNFIEIRISGVPEEIAAREFMLQEEFKPDFDKLNLQEGEQIRFKYKINQHEQKVIVEISKM